MKLRLLPALVALTLAFAAQAPLRAQEAPKPLKILLITGGCCHDYAKQKDILKEGLEARANVQVDIIWGSKTQTNPDGTTSSVNDTGTAPAIPIYGNPDYAKGYDLVIHDECSAGISDPATIAAVLKPHRDGIPGVNLHCAMHCYRIGNPSEPAEPGTPRAQWFEYLGLQSSGHGPQEPIAIGFTDREGPITKGFQDWTTIKEELYNNIKIHDSATALANGRQTVKVKKKEADGTEKVTEREDTTVVVWTNNYQARTRIFSTTIGHNNETVADARYLDLVTRGVLWACDKLEADGKPTAGYGPKGK